MQYFNPFMVIYSSKKYATSTILFPDKLRNMIRYELTATVVHYPPRVDIKYNSSGYPVYSTSDLLLLEAFANKMEFHF